MAKKRKRRKKSNTKNWLKIRWKKAWRKRLLWVAAGLLVLLVVRKGVNPVHWFNLRSIERTTVSSSDYNGIDVSKFQGVIDWNRVAEDRKIQFVYVKATEGSSIVDRRYRTNITKARQAGLKVGSYHFFRGYRTAEEQFRLFKREVKRSEQDLIPMVDVEESGNRKVSRQVLQERLSAFMEMVKREYGVYPLLYSQYGFYNKKLAPEFNRFYIFIARYSNREPVLRGGKYNIWQFSERGRVNGIKGYVDLNRFAPGTSIDDIEM